MPTMEQLHVISITTTATAISISIAPVSVASIFSPAITIASAVIKIATSTGVISIHVSNGGEELGYPSLDVRAL